MISVQIFKELLQYILKNNSIINQIKSFIILAVVRRSVQRVCRAHFRVIAPRQHRSYRRNVVAIPSRWQHCVWFDRPEIWTSDLPLQRRTRYRSTNWQAGQIENESGKTLHAKATMLRDWSRGHLPEPTRKNGRNTSAPLCDFNSAISYAEYSYSPSCNLILRLVNWQTSSSVL